MKFRRAISSDAAAIVALVESAYRGPSSRAGWTTEADLLDGQRTDAAEVAALIDGKDSRIVLVEDAEGLLGTLLIRDEGNRMYIGMFAVRPQAQGQGVGRALLTEAERIGREELGRPAARMTVLTARTDLVAWYERRGYQRSGEREPFPYGDARFGLPRRDDLIFEVLIKALGGRGP
jgi:ribosomal protein S18 acetylase RimI-like enzyme